MAGRQTTSFSWAVTAGGITAAVTTAALGVLFTKYGFEGGLRFLWEGDHLPSDVREALDSIDNLRDKSFPKLVRKVDQIEVDVGTAVLNSVDDGSRRGYNDDENDGGSSTTKKKKEGGGDELVLVEVSGVVKRKISTTSHGLDSLASKVDSVPSRGNIDVKMKKKSLSNDIVVLMERLDSLVSCVKKD